ncbi:MAG: hypothetical protein ABR520_08725 [Mycobacteriales bacterium]|nr:hypothetical protein [Frankia sp.]
MRPRAIEAVAGAGTGFARSADAVRSRAVSIAAIGFSLVVVFLGAAQRLPAVPLIAALIGGFLALGALRRPSRALALGFAAVIVIPIYYLPVLPGTQVGLTPVAVASLVLLPLALTRVRHLRLGALDFAFLALVVLRVVSFLLNYRSGWGATASALLTIALPYTAFRLVSTYPNAHRVFARAVVVAGLPLACIGIAERRGWPNPFFNSLATGYQSTKWARPLLRFHTVRAEASFGHPIMFGMFLAVALALAIALAWTAARPRNRVAYLVAVAVMAAALVDTLSRGPLLMFALFLPLWGITQVARLDPRRVRAGLAMLVVIVAVAAPARDTLHALRTQSTGSSIEAKSARFRVQLVEIAADPANFTWLGQRSEEEGGFTDVVFSRIGVRAVDNTFVLLYLTGGALVMLAFFVLMLLTFLAALRPGLDPVERALAIILSIAFVNLLTVNLSTNFADVFWISLAGLASALQRHRLRIPALANR